MFFPIKLWRLHRLLDVELQVARTAMHNIFVRYVVTRMQITEAANAPTKLLTRHLTQCTLLQIPEIIKKSTKQLHL